MAGRVSSNLHPLFEVGAKRSALSKAVYLYLRLEFVNADIWLKKRVTWSQKIFGKFLCNLIPESLFGATKDILLHKKGCIKWQIWIWNLKLKSVENYFCKSCIPSNRCDIPTNRPFRVASLFENSGSRLWYSKRS